MKGKKVLMISPQVEGIRSHGGLGRAVLELSKHLRDDEGVDVRILIPAYTSPPESIKWDAVASDAGKFSATQVDDVPVLWLHTDSFPRVQGKPLSEDNQGYEYRHGRLSAYELRGFKDFAKHLGSSGLSSLEKEFGFKPDVVHVHDWTNGFVPHVLRGRGNPATVFQVHHAGYDGSSSLSEKYLSHLMETVDAQDLNIGAFLRKFCRDGAVSLLRIGVEAADASTTVSDSYKNWLNSSTEWSEALPVGFGRSNGLDAALADYFGSETTINSIGAIKAGRKAILFNEHGIPFSQLQNPLVAMVARLDPYKGIERVLDALPHVENAVLFIGGPVAEENLMGRLREVAGTYKGRHIIVHYQLTREKVNEIFTAADFFLAPNWGHPEPDGIAAKEAIMAGAIPILDGMTGSGYRDLSYLIEGKMEQGLKPWIWIQHGEHESVSSYSQNVQAAVKAAGELFQKPEEFQKKRAVLLAAAGKELFPWKPVAEAYVNHVYKSALERKG